MKHTRGGVSNIQPTNLRGLSVVTSTKTPRSLEHYNLCWGAFPDVLVRMKYSCIELNTRNIQITEYCEINHKVKKEQIMIVMMIMKMIIMMIFMILVLAGKSPQEIRVTDIFPHTQMRRMHTLVKTMASKAHLPTVKLTIRVQWEKMIKRK